MKFNAATVRISILVFTALLCVMWGGGVWVYERDQYRQLTESLINKESIDARNRGETISADIQRSLQVMYGLPEVLASWQELIDGVQQPAFSGQTDAQIAEQIKAKSKSPAISHINHLLALAKSDFSVDVIWVVDASGNCVAASNFDMPATFIGSNFKERTYFIAAMQGDNGYQYAAGKVSHQPGLYLSAPILKNGKIIGAVVVKVEITRFARDIDFSDAFLVDENGVVILSKDNYFTMKAVPGNVINNMSYERRQSIYMRDQFESFYIQPWPGYSRLSKVGNYPEPYVIDITSINKGELKVYVLSPASQVLQAHDEFLRLFLLITLCGSALCIILAGIALYLHTSYITHQILHLQHDELNEAQRLAKIGSWSYNYLTGHLHCSKELITNFFMMDDVKTKITPTLDYILVNVHPDDREQVKKIFDDGLRNGHGFSVEYRVLRKNGEVRNVIGDAIVEKTSKGQRVKVTGTCRDVTEEQRTLRAIEDNENHLRRVLNSSLIGIIQGNDTGRILDMNQAFMSLTGYTSGHLIEGRLKWKDIASDEYQQLDAPNIFGQFSTPLPFEMQLTASNGHVLPVLIGMAKVEDSRSEWVCFVLDLSERHRINRMQSEFISVVSHELRTPLTSISGSLALLESGVLDQAGNKKLELIKIAHRNSQRLIKIVNDILDMEKLTAGKMKFEMQSVNMAEVIAQAVEFNAGFAQQFNVKFVMCDFPDAAHAWCDANRLMQVLTNLMSNAAKFSPEGGTVDLRLVCHEHKWRIEIHDNGPGISTEFRSRIFSPFAQAEDANVRQKGGTGLGLNITKIMVEKMEGQIGFNSEAGQGATFWVAFPAL
jgi:PAS domain S-box-containing protein